ncbi:hypothetical protein [Allorhodopirellula solitaria]|uniref:Uncharacterized protein n=1 Tax=Allorhodopirellula solitaria TaxID=2527987 RepID=A0A5C5XZ03_9BACT|nr:hypothetical protein [Allorhodopirellula solitaria]TWT67513.1 hypothetical protein CA85_23640 [Allorhodopirellula solitaria]
MKRVIRILLGWALLVLVAALLVTSLGPHPLHGNTLMAHMLASGAFVAVLPLFAIAWLWPMSDPAKRVVLTRVGYWTLLLTGFLTTVTMFLSMLPMAGTETLHELIGLHGSAGYAMAAAAVIFSLGWLYAIKRGTPRRVPNDNA